MLRVAVAALILASTSPAIGADSPTVPAEKRKEFVDAILAKKPSGEDKLLLRLKTLEKVVVDPTLARNEYPADPSTPPSFRDKKSRDKYEEELKEKLAEARAEARRYASDPLKYAPGLKKFSKGEIGTIDVDNFKVADVVDGKRVLITVTVVPPSLRIPNTATPKASTLNLMLAGVDTSNLADGKDCPLRGIYYVTGNAKSSAGTVMQIVPVELTEQELKTIRGAELKTEKK